MANQLKFKAILLQSGKTATGIEIPRQIVEKLNAGKKPLVKITVNNFTYRSAIAVMGGVFMVAVNAENRESAKIKAGDKIEIAIELDNEERVIELPSEFQKVLNKNLSAKNFFDTLSNSKKKVLIIPITNAKTDETRNRNIEKAMNVLVKI
jgi:hypothetical protein